MLGEAVDISLLVRNATIHMCMYVLIPNEQSKVDERRAGADVLSAHPSYSG